MSRVRAALASAPEDAVLAGVSFGAYLIGRCWGERPRMAGALLFAGGAGWAPTLRHRLPVQAHIARPDPFDEESVFAEWVESNPGVALELHRYDEAGHYFSTTACPTSTTPPLNFAWNAAGDCCAGPADGYTLLVATATIYTILPALGRTIPQSTSITISFRLGLIDHEGMLVAVSPKLGVKTLADLIALAKRESRTRSSSAPIPPARCHIWLRSSWSNARRRLADLAQAINAGLDVRRLADLDRLLERARAAGHGASQDRDQSAAVRLR